MNSSVRTFFCQEEDPLRPAENVTETGSPYRKIFRRAVQTVMGSLSFERDGSRVYHTGPHMDKVRRVIDVDGACASIPDSIDSFFSRQLEPVITLAVAQKRDVVVVSAGETKSQKGLLIHGSVPDFTLDVPPRKQWGLAYLTVERLLEISASGTPLDITCNFTRIHLEHIADVLVSGTGSHLDKSEADRIRSQYTRLVALSQGSSLDIEEAPLGAKVKFQLPDQVDLPIHGLEDFLHIVNCHGALMSANKSILHMTSKRGSPFFYIMSFSILPVGGSALTASANYINFVETGDLDWSGPEDDMPPFVQCMQSIIKTATAIEKGNFAVAESAARSSNVGKIGIGNCDLHCTDLIVLGSARYGNALRMMQLLSGCKGKRPYILLHGPNGEGEDDIDAELRNHVMAVQSQCDMLRQEVEALTERKEELEFQITRDEKSITRLQEHNMLVRQMTISAKAAKEALSNADGRVSAEDDGRSDSSKDQLRRAESEARKAAMLQALDRDLALLKEEDARKSEATQQQIRFLTQEAKRCAANANTLERELQNLEKAKRDQEAQFAQEKAQREQEMEEQILGYIAQNKMLLDSRNSARRAAIRNTQDAILRKHEISVRQEKLFVEEMQRNTTELANKIEAENAVWERKLEMLGKQLVEVSQQRDAILLEKAKEEERFDNEMKALDMEAVVLCKYLNDVTSIIWRFENHSSSEAKRLVTIPKCNVAIFDMSGKHTVAELVRLCSRTRTWLLARGAPPPLVYYDVANDSITLHPDAAATLKRLETDRETLRWLSSPMRQRS